MPFTGVVEIHATVALTRSRAYPLGGSPNTGPRLL
jgi:hypothetical protein